MKKAPDPRGSRAFFAMGTDDNQCYVAAKGRQLGLTGQQVTQQFIPRIMGALREFDCQIHQTLHPLGKDDYTRFIQTTFRTLLEKRAVELRKVSAPFCVDTQQFL